jgi:hypothetical protein
MAGIPVHLHMIKNAQNIQFAPRTAPHHHWRQHYRS